MEELTLTRIASNSVFLGIFSYYDFFLFVGVRYLSRPPQGFPTNAFKKKKNQILVRISGVVCFSGQEA